METTRFLDMRARAVGVLGAALALGGACFASGAAPKADSTGSAALPLIRDMPLRSVFRARTPLTIPTADTPARKSVTFPAVPSGENGMLVLRFQARLNTPTPAGWNPYLGIIVNGKPLGRYTRRAEERLLKRAEFVRTTIRDRISQWSRRNGMPVLFTVFGPADVLDKRILNDRDEGYWYLLNISDVVHYRRLGADGRVESDRPNTVTFVNTCVRRFMPKRKTAFPDLIVSDLEIGYLPAALADRLGRLHLDVYPHIAAGPAIRGPNYELRADAHGGMELTVAGERYWLSSFFSFPSEPKMRFNVLAPGKSDGAPQWKPKVEKSADGVLHVRAECAAYAFSRELRADGDRIRVRDTFRNLRSAPIGIVIRDALTLPALPAPGRFRLAGTDRELLNNGCAANPTLFAAQRRGSVGIVVEDDVFRLQLELLRHANSLQGQTTHFGLAPGASYSMEWTVYPGRSTDFFDFVNRVRRDWGVNYTIDGPFVFDSRVVPGRRARIYVFGPWLDYHHSGNQTRAGYRKIVAPILKRLRAQAPGGIFMPKLETNLYTMVKSKIPGGEILPGSDRKKGRYGFVLSPKQSRVLEKGIGPWKDSILYAPNRSIIVDTYYEGYHADGDDLFNLLLYLREGNTRYRLFLDQIDFCMDSLGFNGIYIDQFSQAGSLDRKDRCTYDTWDGHTVDIGPDGRIVRTRTDCNLVGATARAKILKYIFDKGGKVVINGQSTVRETRGFPAWRFQEMDNDNVNPLDFLHDKPPIFYWQARGLLGCPLILGVRPVRYKEAGRKHWAEAITKAVITALRNGVLYYYYTSTIPRTGPGAGGYGPVNHMFPFTPVALHAGLLVGRERIITCVSHTITWPGPEKPAVFRFNLRGLPVPAHFPIRRTARGWEVAVAIDDWNEIVVVERPNRK